LVTRELANTREFPQARNRSLLAARWHAVGKLPTTTSKAAYAP